jgi:hypothetical protein
MPMGMPMPMNAFLMQVVNPIVNLTEILLSAFHWVKV